MYQTLLRREIGDRGVDFLESTANLSDNRTRVIKVTDKFNINAIGSRSSNHIINLHKINDIRDLNGFFRSVSEKLDFGDRFTGCVETIEQRKKRILKKWPLGLNHLYYFLDFVFKRIFPKLPLTKQLYYFITAGRSQVISKAETLGRLVFGGFKIDKVEEINNHLYFTATKIKDHPKEDTTCAGILFKITRVGYAGNPIVVYKIRTMHPYAQYLQEYMYNTHFLMDGGKFKNDFRITCWGRVMRRLWIDEIPMIFNWLKGDIKMVGVRPLTKHYLSLYSEELREKRKGVRPGMIPPFYADMPKTLDEIMGSENKYIEAYIQHPARTDLDYFKRAVRNIIFANARSN